MSLVIYNNGNAQINLKGDGTRIIHYENELDLKYPLNLDLRVSTKCSFANTLCKDFCHESAKVDGVECDYESLKEILKNLPAGIELAIGCNHVSYNFLSFLIWCKYKKFIVNLTMNQGHLKRDYKKLFIPRSVVRGLFDLGTQNTWTVRQTKTFDGLGVSYRSALNFNVEDIILNYENTVFHVIMGIDSISDVISLSAQGVKKILVLGEKDFGYNTNKVDTNSLNHKQWNWQLPRLFELFDVVSFDNLAIEQLDLKRFISKDKWDEFYQGEHSFYIDAVNQTFSRSSRSNEKVSWNDYNIEEYFKKFVKYEQ